MAIVDDDEKENLLERTSVLLRYLTSLSYLAMPLVGQCPSYFCVGCDGVLYEDMT